MKKAKIKVDCVKAQAAYRLAMLDGYAGGEMKRTVKTRKKGLTILTYRYCEYRVVNSFIITPISQYTRGSVEIFKNDVLVWKMTYEGRYPKEVTEFLKMSLLKACEHGEFWGGRGPFRFSQGSWEYRNSAEQGRFEEFSGREQILIGENEVGHGTFQGGLI